MAEQVEVTGPRWVATVTVDRLGAPRAEPARRVLTTSPDGTDPTLVLVRGTATSYRVATGATDDTVFGDDGLAVAVTLLLAPTGDGRHRCAGGTIAVDGPLPDGLRSALGVDAATAADDRAQLELAPRGVLVRGTRAVPWQDAALAGAFLLVDDGGGAVARLDDASLDSGERAAWQASWRGFTAAVNPGNPSLDGTSHHDPGPPSVTFEVQGDDLPALTWLDDGAVQLAAGMVRVLVTEGAPYAADRARSTLVVEPTDVRVARHPGTGDVQVRWWAATDVVDDHRAAGLVPATVHELGQHAVVGQPRHLLVVARRQVVDVQGAAATGVDADATPWREHLVLAHDELRPDPVALARQLRDERRDRTRHGDVELLAAPMVVDDGVVTVPVADVSVHDLVDVPPAPTGPDAGGRRPVTGAVVVGNRDRLASGDAAGEHPWSVAVTGAALAAGACWLGTADTGLRLAATQLLLVEPEVVAHGVWWLATGPTGPEEHLPPLDDWVAGVRSEPLHGHAGPVERPSSVVVAAELEVVDLHRGELRTSVAVRPDVAELARLAGGALDGDAATGPRAWLRHPTLPVVQALPMTQSSTPPSNPTRSRALFPFRPARSDLGWSVTVDGLAPRASWGRLHLEGWVPDPAWQALPGLPAVALSVPGLVLHPSSEGVTAVQRHDVPARDESHALTSLDPTPGDAAQRRGPAHWALLDRRARAAALADVVAATLPLGDWSGRTELADQPVAVGRTPTRHDVVVDLTAYPGSATTAVDGATGLPLPDLDDDGAVAGSVPLARRDDAGAPAWLVDQRGAARGATTMLAPSLVATDVRTVGGQHRRLLTTATPLPLDALGARWGVWFRDLPCAVDPAGTVLRHDDDTPGDGHAWRLGPAEGTGPPLLHGLEVHPVALRSVVVEDGTCTALEVDARLVLPTPGTTATATTPGLVALAFAADASGGLALAGVTAHATGGLWPLSLDAGGVIGGRPVVRWTSVATGTGEDGAPVLLLGGAAGAGPTVEFFAFDRSWSLAAPAPLVVPAAAADGTTTALVLDLPIPAADDGGATDGDDAAPAVAPRRVVLTLHRDGAAHEAALHLEVDAVQVTATVVVDLTGDVLRGRATRLAVLGGPDVLADAGARAADTDEADDGPGTTVTATGVQLAWPATVVPATDRSLLPGVAVRGGVSGYLACAFRVGDQPVPSFTPTHVVAELVLRGTADDPADADLTAGYVGELQPGGWRERLRASGHLRVANALRFPTDDGLLRHEVLVVLDQHELPLASLRGGTPPTATLLADVQHTVTPGAGGGHAAAPGRRFTLQQPVHLATPAATAARLRDRAARAGAAGHGAAGLLHEDVAGTLATALEALGDDVLVVDATALLWLDPAPRDVGDGLLRAVRHLLDGSILAVDAPLDDATDPTVRWSSLQLPCLGTTGADPTDDPRPFAGDTERLLASDDPAVAAVAALLTGAAPGRRAELTDLDRAGGRVVAGLDDPHAAAPRPSSATLDSVTTAALDGGPASQRPPTPERAAVHTFAVSSRASVRLDVRDRWLATDPAADLARDPAATPTRVARWTPFRDAGAFTLVVRVRPRSRSRRTVVLDAVRPRRSATPIVEPIVQLHVAPRKVTVVVGRHEASVADALPGTRDEATLALVYDGRHADLLVDGRRRLHLDVGRPDRLWHRMPGLPGLGFTSRTTVRLVATPAHAPSFRTAQVWSRALGADEVAAAVDDGDPLGPTAAWQGVGAVLGDLIARDGGDVHRALAVVPPAAVGAPAGVRPGRHLALAVRRAPTGGRVVEAVSTELVAVVASDAGGGVRPVASRWSGGPPDAHAERGWAAAALSRDAAASPIAVLRRRTVLGAGGRAAVVAYDFDVVAPARPPDRLGWHGHQLRAEPTALRHPEATFAGTDLPTDAALGDVVAPTVSGVEPVRDADLGWSGLRVVARSWSPAGGGDDGTPDATDAAPADGAAPARGSGAVGATPADVRWLGLQHRVRFAARTSRLPAGFVAPAGPADVDTAATPPVPPLVGARATGDDVAGVVDGFTPVLPDAATYLLVGNRPGALLDLDATVARSDGVGVAAPSGSITATHRVPRPLPLPQDHRPVLLGVTRGPTRRFGADGPTATLVAPARATITTDATALRVRVLDGDGGPPGTLTATLADARTSLPLEVGVVAGGDGDHGRLVELRERPGSPLAALVGDRAPGDVLVLRLVETRPAGHPRTIELPVRVASPGSPLVHTPRFVRFTDPAYDRALTTASQQATLRPAGDDGQPSPAELVVSADRASYGPGSVVALGQAWRTVPPPAGTSHPDPLPDPPSSALHAWRRDVAGRRTRLAGVDAAARTQVVALSDLRDPAGRTPTWQDGDRLEVVATAGSATATLSLAIVATAPTPAPAAAYALLRRDGDGVGCVRYAAGPAATTVAFVDLEDLHTGVVRRRATFAWTDVVRGDGDAAYAVQKVDASGATHVPPADEFVAPAAPPVDPLAVVVDLTEDRVPAGG